jgi:hypothetical protein
MIGFAAKFAYAQLMNYWIESNANQWLLVIRNGELIKKGIGLATWIQPGDKTIKFPSLIQQLSFNA